MATSRASRLYRSAGATQAPLPMRVPVLNRRGCYLRHLGSDRLGAAAEPLVRQDRERLRHVTGTRTSHRRLAAGSGHGLGLSATFLQKKFGVCLEQVQELSDAKVALQCHSFGGCDRPLIVLLQQPPKFVGSIPYRNAFRGYLGPLAEKVYCAFGRRPWPRCPLQ